MSTQVMIPANFGKVSTKFADIKTENDLAAGVQAGFGLIGYKGKVWSIRYRGDEQQLLRDDGDGPRNSIEVVILKAATYISKIWYEKGYVEGSTAAPDCFSPNGVVPDPQSAKRQSNACANCPQNVWGSKITEAGKKGKACGDSKRLAVVPVGDIANEAFGGPMLLRVPAASLQDLATFGNKMQNLGYPYFAIATRISFDSEEAYPKFNFAAIRPLTDAEADVVLSLQPTQEVARVLAEGAEHAAQEAANDATETANAFEQPPVTPKGNTTKPAGSTAANAKPATAKPATTTKKAEAPKPEVKAEVKQEPKPEVKSAGGFGASVSTKSADATATTAKPSTAGFRAPPLIPDDDENGTGEVVEETTEEVVEEASGEGDEASSDFEKSLDDQLAELLGTE